MLAPVVPVLLHLPTTAGPLPGSYAIFHNMQIVHRCLAWIPSRLCILERSFNRLALIVLASRVKASSFRAANRPRIAFFFPAPGCPAQEVGLFPARYRYLLDFHFWPHLPPAVLQKLILKLLHLAARRSHEVLPTLLADSPRILLTYDPTVHQPDPSARYHSLHHFHRRHIGTIAVERLMAEWKAILIGDQRNRNHLDGRASIQVPRRILLSVDGISAIRKGVFYSPDAPVEVWRRRVAIWRTASALVRSRRGRWVKCWRLRNMLFQADSQVVQCASTHSCPVHCQAGSPRKWTSSGQLSRSGPNRSSTPRTS